MLNFLKNLFGAKKEATTAEAPYKVEAPEVKPAELPVEGAGVVVIEGFPFPTERPAEEKKPAKAKKARAPKDPSAPKKPRAKKAK